MTRGNWIKEILILLSTAGIAALLFWMAFYTAGAMMCIPGAIVLFVALVYLRPRMKSLQLLAEHGVFACLLAAQASLLSAILLHVVPNLIRQMASFVQKAPQRRDSGCRRGLLCLYDPRPEPGHERRA